MTQKTLSILNGFDQSCCYNAVRRAKILLTTGKATKSHKGLSPDITRLTMIIITI